MLWRSFLRAAGKNPVSQCFALSKTNSLKAHVAQFQSEPKLFRQDVNLKNKRELIAAVVDEFQRQQQTTS